MQRGPNCNLRGLNGTSANCLITIGSGLIRNQELNRDQVEDALYSGLTCVNVVRTNRRGRTDRHTLRNGLVITPVNSTEVTYCRTHTTYMAGRPSYSNFHAKTTTVIPT